jgi:hypothetical protein
MGSVLVVSAFRREANRTDGADLYRSAPPERDFDASGRCCRPDATSRGMTPEERELAARRAAVRMA